MKTITYMELTKIIRCGLVFIFIFIGMAVFSPLLWAAGNTNVATATDTVTTATGSANTVDVGKIIEDYHQTCMKTDLTEKDMPIAMQYYSQYSDDAKAAVVQTGQCLAMLAEDDASCDLFKDMAPGTVYKYQIAPPGATSTIALRMTDGGAEGDYIATFPADKDGCLDLRNSAAIVRKAVTEPENCAKDLAGYCDTHLAKLADPRDKGFSCGTFSQFMCDLIDINDVDGCEILFKKYESAPRVKDFCRGVLNGTFKDATAITRILWLGGALKDRNWTILSSDFITDSIRLDPAYVVYAGAVKKSNTCFLPIWTAPKSEVCTGIAKVKAGIPNPDKSQSPAGGKP